MRNLAQQETDWEHFGAPGPNCPAGYHLETINLHQRAPVDQDLPVTVCVADG